MPIFCQNIFLSPKKLSTVLPYFVKKLSIYSKTQCSNVIFFHILMKTLCCHAHILSKKRSLLFKLHYSIGQRSQKYASFFSPDFSRNKSLLSCPYFVKKRPFSPKLWCSHTIFAICLSKTPALMPILGEKNVISINTTLHYGPKKSISRKNQCPHARLWSTNFHSLKKTLLPFPYFVKKTSNLSKT